MATYLNVNPIEHEEYTISRRISAGLNYTGATGDREVEKYTGKFDDMLAKFRGLESEPGVELNAELERVGGGIGELRVTREWFKFVYNGDEEEGDENERELGSEDNPSYTSSGTLVPVSILAHPSFANLGALELRALKAMLDGQDEFSLLRDANGTGGKMICDMVSSTDGLIAMDYIRRGVREFMEAHVQVTARWKGLSNQYSLGSVISSVPGRVSTPAGRNWRVDGVGTEEQGGFIWQTATFTLSGAGGWDTFLYGSVS